MYLDKIRFSLFWQSLIYREYSRDANLKAERGFIDRRILRIKICDFIRKEKNQSFKAHHINI